MSGHQLPGGHDYDDDDDKKKPNAGKKGKHFEFECPSCNAHNPWNDGFTAGEEVMCHYCGNSYLARLNDDGKLKLKEL